MCIACTMHFDTRRGRVGSFSSIASRSHSGGPLRLEAWVVLYWRLSGAFGQLLAIHIVSRTSTCVRCALDLESPLDLPSSHGDLSTSLVPVQLFWPSVSVGNSTGQRKFGLLSLRALRVSHTVLRPSCLFDCSGQPSVSFMAEVNFSHLWHGLLRTLVNTQANDQRHFHGRVVKHGSERLR